VAAGRQIAGAALRGLGNTVLDALMAGGSATPFGTGMFF
jgi:hypothetical protein